jgi:hypothetical protein
MQIPKPVHRVSCNLLGRVALISAAILITELALTRIFSVTLSYHVAFLAISVADDDTRGSPGRQRHGLPVSSS